MYTYIVSTYGRLVHYIKVFVKFTRLHCLQHCTTHKFRHIRVGKYKAALVTSDSQEIIQKFNGITMGLDFFAQISRFNLNVGILCETECDFFSSR